MYNRHIYMIWCGLYLNICWMCAFFKFSTKINKFIIIFINFAGVKISVFEIIEYIFFLIDANMLYDG